jgi:hypothetical protein
MVENEKALVQRINRKLENERIRLCRYDSRDFLELGRCYAVNDRNVISAKHIELEEFAKELHVL